MKSFKEIINKVRLEINKQADHYNFDAITHLVNKIESCLEQNEDILWYPAAFYDFQNLLYFNNNRLDFLETHSPILFIHNDIAPIDLINLVPEKSFFSHSYGNSYDAITVNLNNIEGDGNKSILISECSLGKNNKKYKISLFGFSNDELLEIIINTNINIKYLYTTFTSGPGSENSIEPHYYLYFYNILKTKFHIGIFLEQFENIDVQKKNILNFLETQHHSIKSIVLENLKLCKNEIIHKYRVEKVNTSNKIRFITTDYERLHCRFIE